MSETPDPYAPPPDGTGQPYQQPYQQPYPPPYGYQQPAQSAGMAVTSLVLGIVGLVFCPLTAPVAFVLGLIGVRRAGRGEAGGKGMAIAGLVLGVIGTVGWALVTAGLIWFFSVAHDCMEPTLTDQQRDACIDQVFHDRFGLSAELR